MSSQSLKAVRRPLVFGAAALTLLAPMIVPAAAYAAPADTAEASSFGPAVTEQVVVPDGVCSARVALGGAFGGISVGEAPENPDDPDNPGEPEESGIQGAGAVVYATLDVTAGDVLDLRVGGAGANSGAGGLHGGGAGTGGHPGAGGTNTFSNTDPESSGANFNGFAGTAFQGGNGGNDPNLDGSGGGGGGLFGGGGGAATEGAGAYTGSGGGGGSSFVSNSALVSDVNIESNRVAEGEVNEFAALPAFATFEWVMCDYNLAITKSVVGVADDFGGDLVRSTAVFEDGDIARYTVTVTNDGPEAMAFGDTVTLIDDLAVGGTLVSVDGLSASAPAVGEQITAAGIEVFDLVGDEGSERPRGLAVGNSVTVGYDVAVLGDEAVTNIVTTSDRNNDAISADAVIAPAAPELQLVKSADTEKVTKAGQVVTYSFLVTNTGNIEISNIAIAEGSFSGKGKLPAPTCPDVTVQPGESVTCSAEYVAVTADLTGGALTNSATATGETLGGATTTSNDSDVKITTVKPAAPLAVTGGAGLAGIAVGGALLLALGATLLVARRHAGATR